MIVVVMGVTGSGKTVVGSALAQALGWPFLAGEDFHPTATVAKMASGPPLVDADRWPRLAEFMAKWNAHPVLRPIVERERAALGVR